MRADIRASIEADIYRTGGATWRAAVRELYRYLRRDMSDARTQRTALYPKNGDKHVMRTVPFVWRIARELSSVERSRTFVNQDGSHLGADIVGIIERIYRDAQIDRRMRSAHEQLVALNQSTVWVWPDGMGGVRVFMPPPHDQEVEQGVNVSLDERDLKTCWIRLATRRDVNTGAVEYGVAKIEALEATWEEAFAELSGKPLWGLSAVNPIGQIPLVMLRGSDPSPGEWWAPVPEDLLDAQRAINHDQTDVGVIARMQGYSQPVLKGVSTESAKSLLTGPEDIIAVPETGEFTFESPTPDLAGNVAQLEQYVRTVVSANGLNPATLMKSSGITALAKQIELIDRDTERRRHFVEFDRAEQRLYSLIRAWVNAQRGFELLPDARVVVEYRDVYIPADPLHEAQAVKMFMDMGMTSAPRARAKIEGISLDEAMARCDADRAMSASMPSVQNVHNVQSAPTDAQDAADAYATSSDAGAPPALDAQAGDVQGSALNGAQVDSLRAIVESVVAGQLPAEAARQMILISFPVAPANVSALLASLASFEPSTPAALPPVSPTVGAA